MRTRRLRKPLSRSRKPWLERLEPREVLAASVALNEGVLTVLGTNKADKVAIGVWEGQLRVVVNNAKQLFGLSDVSYLKLDLGAGDDRVEISDAVVIDAWISGGKGNDRLRGGGGNDIISGGAGNDKLEGGAGNDLLSGDAGSDWLAGGAGDDELHGGAGNDKLEGGAGNDLLSGDAGNDSLAGGAGDDELHGGAGADVLAGQGGSDMLYGEQGSDKLSGGDGNDALYGGDGADWICGDAGNDVAYGGAGNDRISGGGGDDLLYGEAGNDELFGDNGNDWVEGGAGNDKLQGGLGDDKLKGGAGNDQLDGGKGINLLDGDEGKNKLKNGTVTDFDVPPPENFQSLFAELNGEGSGFAAYDRETTDAGLETFLRIVVNGLAPGQTYNLAVNGVTFAQITVNGAGNALVRFSTIADQDNERPLPADFALHAGDTLTVGAVLSGNFVQQMQMT